MRFRQQCCCPRLPCLPLHISNPFQVSQYSLFKHIIKKNKVLYILKTATNSRELDFDLTVEGFILIKMCNCKASILILLRSCFRKMPPSFHGADGQIAYSLEARLSRSLRIDKTALTELTFVPRVDWGQEPKLAVGVEPRFELFLHGRCPR